MESVGPLSPPEPCGKFHISDLNYSFPVSGFVSYYNLYQQGIERIGEGYAVGVDTQVLWENYCDYYQYRTTRFTGTTTGDPNATFTINVTSYTGPGGPNPAVTFVTTAPDAGSRAAGTASITLVTQEVGPAYYFGGWNGGTYMMYPLFDTNSTANAFLFNWNEEIKSLQKRWSDSGFGASFTPFKAGYDPTFQDANAAFIPTSPGLVEFNDSGRWVFKWLMAHEFGHFFQYELQGGSLAGGGTHSYCISSGDVTSFSEGFADWHASWWEPDGRDYLVPCLSFPDVECYTTCAPGYRLEGNVQAFFWDLFDTENDPTAGSGRDAGRDTVTYSLGLLHNWTNYFTFNAFYDDFNSRGLWTNPATPALKEVNNVNVPE